jgi:sulfite reductase beta subunit-like hemoprotein
VEAYALYVGGNARERRLGAIYPKRIPRSDVPAAIAALLAVYEAEALPEERFSATVARLGVDPFFAAVADARSAADLVATG